MNDTINFDDLENKLETLTGNDFEEAEAIERQLGNNTPMITYSTAFQIRLAAKALGVIPQDIKSLKISEYNDIAARTANFLFATSAEKIRSKKSANLQ